MIGRLCRRLCRRRCRHHHYRRRLCRRFCRRRLCRRLCCRRRLCRCLNYCVPKSSPTGITFKLANVRIHGTMYRKVMSLDHQTIARYLFTDLKACGEQTMQLQLGPKVSRKFASVCC